MPVKAPVSAQRVYARITGGSRQFWCPDCGCFNTRRIPIWEIVPRMVCSNCEAVFYWGTILYRPAPGVSGDDIPPDLLPPQFADIAKRPNHKGSSVNRLRQLSVDSKSWTPIDHTPK